MRFLRFCFSSGVNSFPFLSPFSISLYQASIFNSDSLTYFSISVALLPFKGFEARFLFFYLSKILVFFSCDFKLRLEEILLFKYGVLS